MVGTRPPQGDAELADGPGTASAARHLLRGSGLARPLLEAWKVRHRNIQSSREEKSGNHGFHMNSGGFPAHFPFNQFRETWSAWLCHSWVFLFFWSEIGYPFGPSTGWPVNHHFPLVPTGHHWFPGGSWTWIPQLCTPFPGGTQSEA